MNSVFNPYASIYNNIQRTMSAGTKENVVILPCIVTRIYSNLRVDIYIPYTSTVMDSVPLIFDSFSEEQGNIAMPEENSLSLFLTTSDGNKFVLGGMSLSETYMVRNILPGEAEQYVKRASYKQDLVGNHSFLSKVCSTEIFAHDGTNQFYNNGTYQDSGAIEEFQGMININDTTKRSVHIKKVYSLQSCTKKCQFEDISEAAQQSILNRYNEARDNVWDYLVDIQNIKEDASEDNIKLLRDKINNRYRRKRKTCMITEEGSALTYDIQNKIDLEGLTSQHLAYAEDGTPIIYRTRTFDIDENMTSCYSISEAGSVDFWEKKEEVVLQHNMDDYPMISLLRANPDNPYIKVLDCEVEYLDRYSAKVLLKRKYGVVQSVTNTQTGKFEILMTSGERLYAELGCSVRKLEEMIKQVSLNQ